MAQPDLYTIDGEKLQLGEIVRRCEQIAAKDKKAFFVGRETIRGRLRCSIRTWAGLTSPVASRRQRAASHGWRDGINARQTKPHRRDRHPDDSVYEPEEYTGPDESLDALLGRG